MSREPYDHVERSPLPWRAPDLTECGRPTNELADDRLLTRDQLVARLRAEGIERASMHTCMTCINTARRWTTWDQDPGSRMGREFYGGGIRDPKLVDDLRAIAALVAAHRDEFDGFLADLAGTASLADQAAKARQKQRAAAQAKQGAAAQAKARLGPKTEPPKPPPGTAKVLPIDGRSRRSDV